MSAAPWSFSKIKAFEQCPKQFYNERVLRRYPQQETEAMRYGTLFHEAAEEYIGSGTPIPPAFEFAKNALDKLLAVEGVKHCEQKMGLTADLHPCAFDAEDVWWRGIADLNITNGDRAISIDYKTGRNAKYADKGQLELMSLAIFAHFPEVNTVKAALFFVIAKVMVKETYARDGMGKLWEKWLNKFNTMEAAFTNDVWNTNQSGLCHRHCPVVDCPHNGRN